MLYHCIIKLQGLKEGLGDVIFLLHFKITVEIISINQAGCDLKFNLLIKCMNITSVILRFTFWVKVDCGSIFIEGISPVQQNLIEA